MRLRQSRWHVALSASALSLLGGTAQAEPVRFTARKAEVDLEQRCAELEGDVEVSRGPLRLRAPRLRVRETAAGVDVEGPGRLSGCSCAAPPLELGFERAEISREGDVDLSGPRLMSGDTTLLYLPRLMLRGPDSAGLLPPRLGFSGRDGVFVGLGAELPLSASAGQETEPTRVRVGAGGYSRFARALDGGRLEADVSSPAGRSNVAWESKDGGMFDIDAFGATHLGGAGAAFRVDAARGRRALVGPLSFDRVIAPRDHARLALMSWGAPGVTSYAQIRGDGLRGESGMERVALGGASGFLVDLARSDTWQLGFEADLLGMSLGERSHLGVLRQALAIDAASALGPMAARVGTQGTWVLWSGEPLLSDGASASSSTLSEVSGQAHASVGIPLSRRFGAFRHWVEPRLAFAGQAGALRWAQAEALVDQRFGGPASGQPEVALALAGGTLRGEVARAARFEYFRGEVGAGGRTLAIAASAVAVFDAEDERAALAESLRLRLGRSTGLHLRATFDQALGHGFRALVPGRDALGGTRVSPPSSLPWVSPYAALGTSAGGELWLPLGQRFATSVSSVFDLDPSGDGTLAEPSWLFGSWGGAYRHPCGCLAVSTSISHRLGRHRSFGAARPLEAVDVWVALELFEPF